LSALIWVKRKRQTYSKFVLLNIVGVVVLVNFLIK
jgi:hypothetical protein